MDGNNDGFREVIDSQLKLSATVQGYYNSKKPVTLMQDNQVIGEAYFIETEEIKSAIKETELLQQRIHSQLETNKQLLGPEKKPSGIASFAKSLIGSVKRFIGNEHVSTAILVTCTLGNFYSFANLGSICIRSYNANTFAAAYPYIRNRFLVGLGSTTIGAVCFNNKKNYLQLLFATALMSCALGVLCPPRS